MMVLCPLGAPYWQMRHIQKHATTSTATTYRTSRRERPPPFHLCCSGSVLPVPLCLPMRPGPALDPGGLDRRREAWVGESPPGLVCPATACCFCVACRL